MTAFKDRCRLKRALFYVVFVLAIGSGHGASAAAPAMPPILSPQARTSAVLPPPGVQPIEVRVGLYVVDLVALDQVDQAFTCTAYLTEIWHDPRLAFAPRPDELPRRYYRRGEIWIPLLQFDNSTMVRATSAYLITGFPDGTVRYVEKFTTRLSSNLHLRSFPFDSQSLEAYLHAFSGQARRVVLIPDPQTTGISTASYTPLPLWDMGKISFRSATGPMAGGDPRRSHVVFAVQVTRHSEYYVFRIFLPLVLMVAISWGVLWIPPADLGSQLTIAVTTVLTLVAFSVAVSNVLPPVPYLTFYDSLFLVSFFFILLTIGEAILIHWMHGTDRRQALRLRGLTRWLFPPLFFLTSALMVLIFLR
jgi:hypothetical protein